MASGQQRTISIVLSSLIESPQYRRAETPNPIKIEIKRVNKSPATIDPKRSAYAYIVGLLGLLASLFNICVTAKIRSIALKSINTPMDPLTLQV
jgi:hypothetical protein